MVKLLNIKAKKVKQYTDKKARLILDNPLIGGDYKIVSVPKAETPEEVTTKVSIKPKK